MRAKADKRAIWGAPLHLPLRVAMSGLAIVALWIGDVGAESPLEQLLIRVDEAWSHRLNLLERFSSKGKIALSNGATDEMTDELVADLETHDRLGGLNLPQRGVESIIHFEFDRRGNNSYYNRLLQPNENGQGAPFSPGYVTSAADTSVVLFFDHWSEAAGMAASSGGGGGMTVFCLHDWIDLEYLYSLWTDNPAGVLRSLVKADVDVKIGEEKIQGVRCITVEYDRSQSFSNKVRSSTTVKIALAPEMGYAELYSSLISRWYSPITDSSELEVVLEGSAKYSESAQFPGVWLMVSADMRQYYRGYRVDHFASVDFEEVELGADIPRERFGLQGLGVPVGASLVDRRFGGPSRLYEYTGEKEIHLSSELLLDLAQTLPTEGDKDLAIPEEVGESDGVDVGSNLDVFPRKVRVLDAVAERKDTQLLLVKRKDNSSPGKVSIVSGSPLVEVVSVDAMISSDGIEYAAARIRAVGGEPGTSFEAVVTVQGPGGSEDKVSVPVKGNFVGVNQTYPNGFLLNLIGRDSVYQPLEVANALGEPITISAARPEPEDLPGEITFERVHDGKWNVRYEVKADDVPQDTMEGSVTIEFEDKSATPLTIPVFIMK